MGAWRTLDTFWVNHPDLNRVAESKLLQLRTAIDTGFDVPESLVTNDREEVHEFLAAHPDGVICKPLMIGRLFINEDERLFFTSPITDTVSLANLGAEPYLFQEFVPKLYDIRATVIGNEVFAVRIDSQDSEETRVDWRQGQPGLLDHTPIELDTDLADACVTLCRRFGLRFGAIDLACRPDGRHTFFEINPNGQWAWVEQRTGLPLRSRMVDLLLSGGAVDA
jgi:glutathione synthase/RimK-type ligase-like ATP-grasp enzyme